MYRTSSKDNNIKKSNIPSYLVGNLLPEEKSEEDMTRKEKIERNKYLPIWKQSVYDEEGRRVLHGAFKGGWSAGYHNTVGSKEGFTPLGVITSSRTKKANIQKQRIEDFLDEEDLEDMRIGDKGGFLSPNTNFSFGTPLVVNENSSENTFLSSLLAHEEFIGAPTESIGYKILRNMGWRDSRAVGLNLRERNKKRKRQYGVTGITPMDKGDDDDVNNDDNNGDYVSPYFMDDVKVITFKKKDDLYGVGYDPFKMAPEFRSRRLDNNSSSLIQREKNKNIISMSGFEDDSKRFKSNVHIDLYDEFDTEIDVGYDDHYDPFDKSSSSSSKKESTLSRLNALSKSKFKKFTEQSSTSSSIISGFVKATKEFKVDYFEPPELPRDYQPKMMPGKRRPASSATVSIPTYDYKKYGTLTPNMRSVILGETNPVSRDKKTLNSLPVDENVLHFKDDPEKSKRYLLWLRKLNGEDVEWDKGLSFDQKVKENQDFVRLWNMTKPLSGFMADKFTRPTTLTTLGNDQQKSNSSDNNNNIETNV